MIKGIGTDIIAVNRIATAIAKNQQFCRRLFTETEIDYSLSKRNKEIYFAARFAAKEAVMKALSKDTYKIAFRDIEIFHDENNKPMVRLTGKALEVAKALGVMKLELSISHCDEYAVAFVIAI